MTSNELLQNIKTVFEEYQNSNTDTIDSIFMELDKIHVQLKFSQRLRQLRKFLVFKTKEISQSCRKI